MGSAGVSFSNSRNVYGDRAADEVDGVDAVILANSVGVNWQEAYRAIQRVIVVD